MDESLDWKKLNELVEMFGMDRKIATNRMWSGRIPSDMMFSTIEQLVCRRFATKNGLTYSEVEFWGPRECGDYYRSILLDKDGHAKSDFKLEVNSDKTIKSMVPMQEYPDITEVLEWRWNNGYSLLSYGKRVDVWLDRMATSHGKQAAAALAEAEKAMEALSMVRGELDRVVQNHPVSDRARHIIENLRDNLTIRDFIDAGE